MELSKNEIERQDRQRALRGKRVKSISLWLIGVAVTAAAVYGLVLWSKKDSANKPGIVIAELGSDHIPDGQRVGEYNSNPRTGGFTNSLCWMSASCIIWNTAGFGFLTATPMTPRSPPSCGTSPTTIR